MSMNKDHSHSWVRISHESNKFVMNLNNDTEVPEDQALQLNVKDLACRSKANEKPQRRTSASSSTKTIPVGERTWTDIEP